MELCNIINKIEVPTVDLKVEHIQELLVLVKAKSKSDLTAEFWEEAAQPLWHHLKHCLGNLDDQLLCATCFYSVIPLTGKKDQDHYMDKLLYLFGHESNSPSRFIRRSLPSSRQLPFGVKDLDTSATDNQIAQSTSTLRIVSLIYGMFQSSFLTNIKEEDVSKVSLILKEIFNLLLSMGYEYSEYTFLVFKIMTMYKKVCGGPLEKYIFNNENQLKLLALVNNNWENPVTGVRDLNRSIFQTLLSILDNVTYQRVRKYIDGFYWNKAKFLMVSDIIETQNENILWLMGPNWIDGLIYSLHKPGLVSAGADMYYALLKKIDHPDDWCQVFLVHVLKILSGSCTKAINNFCNYWCLTTLKKFRTISEILIDELEELNGSDQVFYSKLSIMKQSNKLGILDKNWSIDSKYVSTRKTVLAGIDIYNTQIRMSAFDIVCISQGKSVPSLVEYNLILDYLSNNLNSDSTVLRISMLGSLNYFLVHLHSTFKNVIKKTGNSEGLNNLLDFCKRLQNLIGNNIIVTGNYQRKITSVKLCDSILNSFSTITKKKGRRREGKGDISVEHDSDTLIDFLKQHNCWLLSTGDFVKKLISLLKDPADDVRDNVIKILLSYYTNELQYDTLLQEIVNDAKTCVQSKFFYEIGCGQSMFKLIVNLLLKAKSHTQTEYRSVEDIFDFVFKELNTHHKAKTNVLNSIEMGQQLHSYLSILLVVLEGCNTNFYSLTLLDGSKMSRLLQVLESVSNQFVWEQEGSSDFSEMNDMIQNIINTSDYNSLDEADQAKISGLQQIVLNCLWLNVKATCDLAAMLIQYNVKDVSMCERSLNIITRVLETSRHKGAIEAAGAALGRAIHYLTTLPENNTKISTSSVDVSRLPFNLLKVKLNDLISETNKMSSVTRRGAGLSIMLHRIVSNDMKKGKPLFHYFLKILLNKCKHPKALSSVESNVADENMENQVDLPAAIYIHFLTRIVTDSSLATDVMFYSTELAELAFGNLTSSHWQIRNAALQLYGALMPRLIGQKKASGIGDETISTVACDEMLTHSPKLWKHITEQLKQKEGDDLIQTHSNLVPILNILANCAKRYHFPLSPMEEETEIIDLFYHLMLLLSSPIYTVRRLTAKAIFNIYEFEHISDSILKQENVTENQLHGMLLLLSLCVNYYSSNVYFESTFKKHREKFNEIFRTRLHSYMCKNLYEDVFDNAVGMVDIENTILELNGNVSPGIQTWAEARLKRYVNKCSWNDMLSLLNLLLHHCNYDNFTAFFELLLLRIEQETIDTNTLQQMAKTLMSYENMCSSSITWKILYEISRKIDLHHCIDIDLLLRDLNRRLYAQRYMVPLIARHIEYASDENKSILLGIIQDMSDFEKSDVDMRYIAAVANNELSHNFNKLPDSQRVVSIKCAVLLLQDEDEDIRNLSVNFYFAICRDERIFQPYICLNKILDKSFLNSVFAEPQKAIVELRMKITDLLKLNHKVDEYNPFANDSKNIYFESHVLKDLVDNLNV